MSTAVFFRCIAPSIGRMDYRASCEVEAKTEAQAREICPIQKYASGRSEAKMCQL
jgi:hypothetical protein